MSGNGGELKKIVEKVVDLSAERLKNEKTKPIFPNHGALEDALRLPKGSLAPPEGLKELTLSEAYEFAREIVAKYSDNEVFMKEYTERYFSNHPLTEERAAESAKMDLKNFRHEIAAGTSEDFRQLLSYSKAASPHYHLLYTFVTAEAFLTRFPTNPKPGYI